MADETNTLTRADAKQAIDAQNTTGLWPNNLAEHAGNKVFAEAELQAFQIASPTKLNVIVASMMQTIDDTMDGLANLRRNLMLLAVSQEGGKEVV